MSIMIKLTLILTLTSLVNAWNNYQTYLTFVNFDFLQFISRGFRKKVRFFLDESSVEFR